MKVRTLGLGLVLGVTLTAAPALAQDAKGGSGAPNGGASERSGGGGAGNAGNGMGASSVGSGGSVSTGGGGGSTSASGGAFSSPMSFGASSPNLSVGDRGIRETAPGHRAGYATASSTSISNSGDGQKATPRSSGGSGSNNSGGGGERAVPRGSASNGSGSNGGGGNTRARAPIDSNNASGVREVPEWSRPRGNRPDTGTAVDRTGPPPDRNGGSRGRYYDPYYYGYGGYYDPYYSYRYGYGYGYYPYALGLGYGLYSGFGWDPYFGDPYDSGYGGYSSGVYNTHDQGNLKLKVKPRNAKVYVDGYFVGLVDQFDGAFQKLTLNGGRHKVEVRADGFESAEFDVLITPEQTVTFQGDLKRIQ